MKTRTHIQFGAVLALAVALFVSACNQLTLPVSDSLFGALGTTSTIAIHAALPGANVERAFERSFERIEQIHSKMSLQEETSELNAVNRAAGRAAVQVSQDTFVVLEEALRIAQLSDGAFDPTIGPIVSLWDITGQPYLPSQEEIDSLLPLVDYRHVEINSQTRSVKLLHEGMKLDLGAIAKGYAADEVARVLQEEGVSSAIIDLGGNVYVLGSRPDGSPWRVAVQDPFATRNSYLGVYQAVNESIVSSGTYERYFEQDGVRYHHLFDPKTGYPARPHLASVTILAADSSMLADAFATAAFVLGLDKGREFLESVAGVEGFFVLDNASLAGTSGIAGSDKVRILKEGLVWVE